MQGKHLNYGRQWLSSSYCERSTNDDKLIWEWNATALTLLSNLHATPLHTQLQLNTNCINDTCIPIACNRCLPYSPAPAWIITFSLSLFCQLHSLIVRQPQYLVLFNYFHRLAFYWIFLNLLSTPWIGVFSCLWRWIPFSLALVTFWHGKFTFELITNIIFKRNMKWQMHLEGQLLQHK